jgi:hypothetical protein
MKRARKQRKKNERLRQSGKQRIVKEKYPEGLNRHGSNATYNEN